ncbi:hypothetical protein DFH09DRAFT_906312 [Mycena vulgaris]|nr:hypothetical protein DFH09DRAFT_906312 [Mycena vulgaris]
MPGTDDEGSARPPNQGSLTQTGRRKRMRVFTPDDRATYRVVEKQRREALNTQFIELARLLPGLATTRRLSKSIIVTESIVHQKKQRDQRLACAQQIRAMRVEQESLLAEVNALRAQLGITERREGEPVSAEAAETLTVEEEVFGAFLAGISDNDDDANEGEDDVGGDLDEDRRGLSAVRRSRRSTSRSMSNASARSMSNTSNRASSRSPASSIGTRAWSAGPLNVSPSPPAQSEMSPAASTSDASSIAGTPPSAYDADFLAMFASPSPSILTTPLSFGFPPTNDMVSPLLIPVDRSL